MNENIAIAAISLVGSVIGTFGGIIASSRLTIYRINQLEQKVNKHNSLIERMVAVEQSTKQAHKRIDRIQTKGID